MRAKTNRGTLVIISSPSGGGKNVVINELVKIFPDSGMVVTTTSRPPRAKEKDGVDYHFVNAAEFQRKLAAGEFLEHNNYAGNWYGTEKKALAEAQRKYTIAFSQVEVNGKHNIARAGIPHLSVFLLPESLAVLRARIEKRGGIAPKIIAQRLKIAETEIAESRDYDLRLINADGKLAETTHSVANFIRDRIASADGLDKKPVIG